MLEIKKNCDCNTAPTLIFACSGCADIGEVTDQAARKLSKEGVGKMFCLAGIGGRIESFVTGAQSAAKVLVIDGCPMDCARPILVWLRARPRPRMRI